jgi:hypothetical protein
MYKNYQSTIQFLLTSSIILACFSVNLPTAFMSALTILIIILFLLSGDFRTKFKKIIYLGLSALILGIFTLIPVALSTLPIGYRSFLIGAPMFSIVFASFIFTLTAIIKSISLKNLSNFLILILILILGMSSNLSNAKYNSRMWDDHRIQVSKILNKYPCIEKEIEEIYIGMPDDSVTLGGVIWDGFGHQQNLQSAINLAYPNNTLIAKGISETGKVLPSSCKIPVPDTIF